MRTIILAAGLALTASGAHAGVYKCPAPGGGTVYTDTPCSTDAKPVAVKHATGGPKKPVGEIEVLALTCQEIGGTLGGYGKMTGWVRNNTDTTKEVEVTAMMMLGDMIDDTHKTTVVVPANDRIPFDYTLKRRLGNKCNIRTTHRDI